LAGGWTDPAGNLCLDVCDVVTDVARARDLAARRGAGSFWDAQATQVVWVAPADLERQDPNPPWAGRDGDLSPLHTRPGGVGVVFGPRDTPAATVAKACAFAAALSGAECDQARVCGVVRRLLGVDPSPGLIAEVMGVTPG
jgi:hypothetical protein